MEKWAKANEDSSTDVMIKFNRSREKLIIEINDKYLTWEIEEVTRHDPEKYSSVAEFIRRALTKEVNSNKKWELC